MSQNYMHNICTLIENTLSIKKNIIGDHTWQRIIENRMRSCQISEPKHYYHLLHTSSSELQCLIDDIVIPETWFLRDSTAFNFLKQYITQTWSPNNQFKTFRALSVPCSSGEEAYSIAITIKEAGILSSSFQVDGIDISQRLIEKAKKGVYSKNSFRSKDVFNYLLRHHYLTELTHNAFQIAAVLQKNVNFNQSNVFDPSFNKLKNYYNAIFSRNLLIYLQPEAQITFLNNINSMLAHDGIFFVAPSEIEFVRNCGFQQAQNAKSNAFIKKKLLPSPSSSPPQTPHADSTKTADITPNRVLLAIENTVLAKNEILPPRENSFLPPERLLNATQQANMGNFTEAIALCLDYINEHAVDAAPYYLIGVIQHAAGHFEQAEEFFRKTVYLDPNHYEALIYLAMLAEQKGDFAQHRLYKQRAQKSHLSTQGGNP